MSNFFQSKKFLTLWETAAYLTKELQEEVIVADIYRAALHGQIVISVNFVNNARGCIGKIVCEGEANRIVRINPPNSELGHRPELPEGEEIRYITGLPTADGRFIEFNGEVVVVEGIWDLMMIGSERFEVEHGFQMETGGPPIDLASSEGCIVQRGDTVCRLMSWASDEFSQPSIHRKQKPSPYTYAEALPSNCVWGVRTEAITGYLNMLKGGDSQVYLRSCEDKPLSTKERYSLLVLLAAVCHSAKLDYTKRGVAISVAESAQKLGVPISEDTIRKFFSQIPDAVAARSK